MKKEKFIDFVEKNLFDNLDMSTIDSDVVSYWEALKIDSEAEKPVCTDSGAMILKFLQDHSEQEMWKSKDIAEELFVSSRVVSGAFRKLVNDGFVSKMGADPVVYSITEKGKTIEIA